MHISTEPTWAGVKKLNFNPLKKQANSDVVIVGGGMAGVLTAYNLAKRGKKVVILEAGEIGAGTTTYTTGFLTNVIDTDIDDMVKIYGVDDSKLIWDSHYQAIGIIEKIVNNESIECEFVRCNNYVFVHDAKDLDDLKSQKEAADIINFDTKIVNSGSLNFENGGAWVIKKQAKFHPTKFLYGLLKVLKEMGVEVYEHSEVKKIKNNGVMTVRTKSGVEAVAQDVIIATYKPFNNPKEVLFKKGKYKSYIFEVQIPKGVLEEAIYEDTENPYNYFRIDAGVKYDRMILGGQDHRNEIKMHPNKNFKALEEVLKRIMGDRKYTIKRKWDGMVLEPSDGLALIGQVNDHEYVATAFSGNGLTYSAIASEILADQITGKKNVWAKVYDPTRIPSLYQLMKKGQDYTGELIGGAVKNIVKSKKSIKLTNKPN